MVELFLRVEVLVRSFLESEELFLAREILTGDENRLACCRWVHDGVGVLLVERINAVLFLSFAVPPVLKFDFCKGQISARGTAYSPCCAAINKKRRSASAFCKSTPSRECSVQNKNLRKSSFEHLLIKLKLRR